MDLTDDLLLRVETLNAKFRRACDQIELLSGRLALLRVREQRVRAGPAAHPVYPVRLSIATLHGVRLMFSEYARRVLADMETTQRALQTTLVGDDGNGDDDDDGDDRGDGGHRDDHDDDQDDDDNNHDDSIDVVSSDGNQL